MERRGFVGGVAAAVGALTLHPGFSAQAQQRALHARDEYDSYAKLAANENPYGPPESVMQAMTRAFKYANRYGYPDGDITWEIAQHHGVKPENILLGAGSGEILDVAGTAFLSGGKKVVCADPTFDSVYAHATSIKADAIRIPLQEDFCQDIGATIQATKAYYRECGFVYLCNPNNPTGRIVTTKEVKLLLDGVPPDMPVLIDEAYHHFVESPEYATSVPYVIEGRPVIVTRTFSKIAALAGMRLGYAIAPPELVRQMRPYTMGSINALVKWGGVAALKDLESQATVKRVTLALRKNVTEQLSVLGFKVIPSDANFFMVDIGRPVLGVIPRFREQGILVGRPFPPMMQHLRVSVGTADEMARFMTAFRRIVV